MTYLTEQYSHQTRAQIAQKLGRSERGVLKQVFRMGLSPFLESENCVTMNEVLRARWESSRAHFTP